MAQSEKLVEKVRLALSDFSGVVPRDFDIWDCTSCAVPRDEFPVPELVLFLLRDLMGFPWSGRGEKVRWSVYCVFRGEPLVFELRKFGFTVCSAKEGAGKVDEALRQLKKSLRLAEPLLEPIADQRISNGEVTVANLFGDFDGRYRFFREKADHAYVTKDAPMRPTHFDQSGRPRAWTTTLMKGPREGSYYTAAMIDAFFSRLEHALVLVLPFIGFDPKDGSLRRFMSGLWDEKLKIVLDIKGNKRAKTLYDRLKDLKEHFRNPLSHGGFERSWASLYFHVEGIGALPACLSGFRKSLQFRFLPIEHEDHKSVCSLFDEVDELFASNDTRMAWQYIHAGLDIAFDDQTLKSYKEAMTSEKIFTDFINRECCLVDMHMNMDY